MADAFRLLLIPLLLQAMFLSSLSFRTGSATETVEEQRRADIGIGVSGNLTTGSGCSDGDGLSYECQLIAYTQPDVELNPARFLFPHRSLLNGAPPITYPLNKFPSSAGCGRHVPGQRYYSCTTDQSKVPRNPQKCSATTRLNPCP